MKKNILYIFLFFAFSNSLFSQFKVGSNPKTITSNTFLEVESTSGSKIVIRKDTAMMGINNSNPNNKLEITHGTSGNSGLRFTNLTNANSAKSANSVNQKYLSVNSVGDVVLANSVDQLISVTGLATSLTSPVAAATFQAGVFEDNYSKIDSEVVYVNQTDGTLWIYSNSNGGQYNSYNAPASTAWFNAGSTIDAGSNKTGAIYRTGNVGIGVISPAVNLHVNNSLSATATVNADAQVLRLSRPTTAAVKWSNLAQFNLGSYNASPSVATSAASRLDLAMNDGNSLTTSNIMTWQANGNVGILKTNPLLQLQLGNSGNLSANRVYDGNSFEGFGFHHYINTSGENVNSFTRVGDIVVGSPTSGSAGGGVLRFLTSTNAEAGGTITEKMRISSNGNVGVGTTTPISKFQVSGASTNTTSFNAGATTTIDFSQSNLAYTTASAGSFTLNNIKDGGTYTLALQGAGQVSGTAAFTATGFTIKYNNSSATTAGKETVYTFLAIGTRIYVYQSNGM